MGFKRRRRFYGSNLSRRARGKGLGFSLAVCIQGFELANSQVEGPTARSKVTVGVACTRLRVRLLSVDAVPTPAGSVVLFSAGR